MNTWRDEIINILQRLGGHAYLKDIYAEYLRAPTRPGNRNPEATIRDALEKGCADSKKYDHRGEVFYMLDGKSGGHYGLVEFIPGNQIDLTQDDDEFSEGKLSLKKHILRERNYRLVFEAKKRFKAKHGKLFCEVCGFDFEHSYGELGVDFIEAHHLRPVSQLSENDQTNINELVMLCSNCHSMVHRKQPWPETLSALREICMTSS